MKQWLTTTWSELKTGRNFDVYLSLGVAAIVFLLTIFGNPDPTTVFAAILAVLSIMAFSTLEDRRANNKLQELLRQIDKVDSSIEDFITQEYDHSDVERRIRACSKAFFWGFTFTRTIPLIKDEVENCLKSGLQVRFLLLKPSSEAVRMNAFRKSHQDKATTDNQLITNLSYLAEISKRTKNTPGKLEVKYIDQLPPWSIIATDPHLPAGHMYVRLASFRVLNKLRPTFELIRCENAGLYEFFSAQFETVWNDAEPVDLDRYSKNGRRSMQDTSAQSGPSGG